MSKSFIRCRAISSSRFVLIIALALLPTRQASAQPWNPLETKPKPNLVVGLIASETLRLCLASPESARRPDRPSRAAAARFRVLDVEGDVLAQSGEIAVHERQTRCWDVRRSALPRVGEPGTGRLQVRAIIEVRVTAPSNQDHPGFLPSAEIIDNSTGGTKLQPIIGTLIGSAVGN